MHQRALRISVLRCVTEALASFEPDKFSKAAEQHWRKLNGFECLAKSITGGRFRYGIEVRDNLPAQTDLVAA